MAIILSQKALFDMLTAWTAIVSGTPYSCGLFTNNHTPVVTDTFAAYTEATFSGYGRVLMPAALTPVWNGVNAYNQQFNAINFTWSGGGGAPTIYGYFVVAPGDLLVFADLLFPGGLTLSLASPSVTFIPTIDTLNEF